MCIYMLSTGVAEAAAPFGGKPWRRKASRVKKSAPHPWVFRGKLESWQ